MNVSSINELGGDFRNFVESSKFTIENKKITTEYRGKKIETHKTIDDIRKDLPASIAERKREWGIK